MSTTIIFVAIAFLLVLVACAYFGNLYGALRQKNKHVIREQQMIAVLQRKAADAINNMQDESFEQGVSFVILILSNYLSNEKE